MPIDPQAVKRFLERPLPPVPDYKQMELATVHRHVVSMVGTPAFKMQPWDLQVRALAHALYCERALLLLRMRMGKTKVFYDYAQHLRRAGAWTGRGIVIVPSPILLSVWEEQAAVHSDLSVYTLYASKRGWLDALDSPADLIVTAQTNLRATFVQPAGKRSKRALAPDMEALEAAASLFSLCGIDEIHTLASPESLAFRQVAALTRHCTYRLGLTGTPFHRDPFKLWAQAYLVDGGATLGRSYFMFQQAYGAQRYNHFARNKKEWVFDKDKLPLLSKRLGTLAISYDWSEIRELPMVVNPPVRLSMSAFQEDLYRAALTQLLDTDQRDSGQVRSAFQKWRQISSGFVQDEDGTIAQIPGSAKHAWFNNFLEHEWDGRPMIIFYDYTATGKSITELLAKHKAKHGWLRGATATAQRTLHVAAFQRGALPVLVLQHRIASMGLDLSAADYLLFFESPVSGIDRDQCKMRPMAAARGDRVLLIDDLVCSAIEQRILAAQAEGADLVTAIFTNRTELKATLQRKLA